MPWRDCLRLFAAGVLVCAPAGAQSPQQAASQWTFYASALGYVVPQGRSYVSPVLTADRGALHLEARYNYEDLETGSLWLGSNFSFGNKVTFSVTPMIGGVYGNSNGVAPGYLMSLGYGRLSLASQGEYLVEAARSKSFFYNWSEISYSPAQWFRAGIAVQHTKAYRTTLDVQRGLLAGFSYRSVDFTAYVFNLGWTDPTAVFAIGVRF